MKKILSFLLLFLLALSLAGCGAKEKIEEKAGEALAEKMIEEAGGSDVDINGDKVVIKGEDGEEITFGETEWPTSDIAKSIPEFKDGKIVSVMEANGSLLIILEEVAKEDAAAYLDEVKKIFTEESFDMGSEGNMNYVAKNSEGLGIMLVYAEDETFGITLSATQEEE
jgi:hypothetical protein